jgi:uncharacterized membrane protein YfcA
MTRQVIALLAGAVGFGLVTGFLSGLLGVGGGIIMVPLLHLVYGREMQVAVGTSLAAMVAGALAGMVRHAGFGNVDWPLAAGLGIGTLLGAYLLGAPLAEAIPSELLRRLFGGLMCLVGLHMVGLFDWLAKLWARP